MFITFGCVWFVCKIKRGVNSGAGRGGGTEKVGISSRGNTQLFHTTLTVRIDTLEIAREDLALCTEPLGHGSASTIFRC